MYKNVFGRNFFGTQRKERRKLTEEEKKALSERTRKWWDEHPEARQAASERQKNRSVSEEEKQARSQRMKDSWANDPERHEKTSELMTNTLNEYYKTHRNYWYGKKRTPEQIEKVVEAKKANLERRRQEMIDNGELVWDNYKEKFVKPVNFTKRPRIKNVRCIENGKIYKDHIEAAYDLGLKSSAIRSVLVGKLKSTGKYHFEIVEENSITDKD